MAASLGLASSERDMGSMRLHYHILPRTDVSKAMRETMYALFTRCFDCVSRERFEADLGEKDFVVLLLDEADTVKGFSTQEIMTHEYEGELLNVLFSGDTVVEPECWGTHELARGWCEVAAQILRRDPARRLFWLLISKGFRTYLYLPLFFRSFLPCYVAAPVPELTRLSHSVALKKFGLDYDASCGVVRFVSSCGQLKSSLAEIPMGRASDPHVQFFLERNPGYASGDELVCLAEVSLDNTIGIGHRWLKRALES
jgi:hypothetical protein